MSIHERNRYKKEIDILINRLSILQGQEKSYADLTKEIGEQKKKLQALEKQERYIDKEIDKKNAKNADLSVETKELQDKHKNTQKDISNIIKTCEKDKESYKKQIDIYNNHLDKIQQTIKKNESTERVFKKNMNIAEDEYNEYVSKVKREKGDLLDKVMNNESLLIEQRREKEKLKTNIKNLKGEFSELDIQYQKLLETYIITQ